MQRLPNTTMLEVLDSCYVMVKIQADAIEPLPYEPAMENEEPHPLPYPLPDEGSTVVCLNADWATLLDLAC